VLIVESTYGVQVHQPREERGVCMCVCMYVCVYVCV